MQLGKRRRNFWSVFAPVTGGGARVLLTSLGVASCVIGVRLAGLLHGWELAGLDQFLRLRPPEPTDDRLVVVTINEHDLRQVGAFPISDHHIAQLLEQLAAAKPRAIGLDIYRDLPVKPGHAALLQVLKSTPNLVAIDHIADEDSPDIPPPPPLKSSNQIGFNNIVHDTDDKVRRAILYSRPQGDRKAKQSFALALALKYLKADGITPKAASDRTGYLQLGAAVFHRFTAYDAPYIRADDGGYQILINPRNPAQAFRRISMMDVLAGRVSPDVFRDRVVLIGYTAVSVNDFVLTSYSSELVGAPDPLPGVELHATIVSQIIHAALGQRPLLTSWSEPWEWLWILAWAWLGAVISWQLRSLRLSLTVVVVAGFCLLGLGFALLSTGLWIPVVPPMLAMVGSVGAVVAHVARLERELRRSKEFLNTIINTIPDPIFVKDRSHQWIVLNDAFAQFLQQPVESLLERSVYDVFPVQEAIIFQQYDEVVFETGQSQQNEESFTDRNGITYHIETKRSLHRDAAGNLFLVGIIRDITQRKQMEEDLKRTAAELHRSNAELQRSASQLNHIANHDCLTGLPNRKLFHERLEQATTWAQENHQLVALLFLDLDGFKQINDSKGHDVGDLLLQSVAHRLSSCLRGSDTVARLGGDEFTVILPAIPSGEDAARVADKVLATLARPFNISGHSISITTSIGISIYPNNAQDLETLVKEADNAMYQAKQHGKSRYEFPPFGKGVKLTVNIDGHFSEGMHLLPFSYLGKRGWG